MRDVHFSTAERVIMRNQRLMMLALSNIVRETTKTGNEYHATKLTDRVKEMEANLDWIASPSERI